MQWLLFIAFWVVLAIVVFFVAMRGPGGAAAGGLELRGRSGRNAVAFGFLAVLLGMGIAVPTVIAAGNTDHDRDAPLGTQLTASQVNGRELFVHNCATCHTLSAANAVGRVGPNLDQLRPTSGLVLDAIKNGRARGGIGQMPYGLLQGEDAQDVAAYVARVAGK